MNAVNAIKRRFDVQMQRARQVAQTEQSMSKLRLLILEALRRGRSLEEGTRLALASGDRTVLHCISAV